METFLKRQKIPYFIAFAILLLSSILMLSSSLNDSAIMDEIAHIPAGYTYVKLGNDQINPEHPPLLKDLAGLSLLISNIKINIPIDSQSWTSEVNDQWNFGRIFLYESGNDADKIIQISRFGSIFLTILTGLLFYIFCKKRLGKWWALLPLFLFSLSPLVLAHGHYVTTDVAAAFGVIIAFWSFTEYLKNPSTKKLLIAGAVFGIAQLCKFSLILLIPLFLVLGFIFYLIKLTQNWQEIPYSQRRKQIFFRFFKMLGSTILIFAIGAVIIYLVYLPQNINYPKEKQSSDTAQILNSFAYGADPNWETCTSIASSFTRQMRCLANIDIWMSNKPVLKPLSQYLLGVLMVFDRSSAGNTGYFLGQVSNQGWKTYFPIVFLIKEQIPSLILIFIALIFAVKKLIFSAKEKKRWSRIFGWIWQHFTEFSMLFFVIFYWFISIKSPLNIGFRHLLPIIPFTYLLTAYEIKKWWRGEHRMFFISSLEKVKYHLKHFGKTFLKSALLTILLLWYFTETILAAPYFISYFNEIIGGSKNGYLYAVDSNADWGQDLKRLAKFVEENNIEKIKIDYFGGGNLNYYFGEKVEIWNSAKGIPEQNSWLAVSYTFLQNSQGTPIGNITITYEDSYWWLKDKEPYAVIGNSIAVYKY